MPETLQQGTVVRSYLLQAKDFTVPEEVSRLLPGVDRLEATSISLLGKG